MRLTKNIKISAKLHNEIMTIKQELSDEEDRHTTVDDTLRLAVACLKRERGKR
ncbi:MAG TPA: hypothetical protein VED16_05470 [Candidatus Acidoferrum sp.]|nr:hypothetical protein [Candidatus Acidoferrum sp.]